MQTDAAPGLSKGTQGLGVCVRGHRQGTHLVLEAKHSAKEVGTPEWSRLLG